MVAWFSSLKTVVVFFCLCLNSESAEGPETPLSVKSRVQDMSRRHSDVIEQDGELAPKPTKKRPKSEAFERFEKEGIVIGLVSVGLTSALYRTLHEVLVQDIFTSSITCDF